MMLKVFHVIRDFVDFVNDHAAMNSAKNSALAVVREVHAGSRSQIVEDDVERRTWRRGKLDGYGVAGNVRVTRNTRKFVSNSFGRKYVIHTARQDRASGHAVIFCGSFVLGKGHAAVGLNFTHAQPSIGARAGKDHANSAISLLCGK